VFEKMNLRLKLLRATGVVIIVIVLGFFAFSVRAQTDVDKYFETVRGELIGFYGSEMVSHAAILLGLVVAFPSTGWRALRSVSYRYSYKRGWALFLNFICLFVSVSMMLLIFYFFGRTVVWSFLSSGLVSATPANVGITESNVTSCMTALADYAGKGLKESTFWSQPFIILVNPPESFILPFLTVSIVSSLVFSCIATFYRKCGRLRAWFHFECTS
jgi:succinate dehydrogenase hydrophobic anchor subunit